LHSGDSPRASAISKDEISEKNEDVGTKDIKLSENLDKPRISTSDIAVNESSHNGTVISPTAGGTQHTQKPVVARSARTAVQSSGRVASRAAAPKPTISKPSSTVSVDDSDEAGKEKKGLFGFGRKSNSSPFLNILFSL
jgi:hypothetical protein